MALQVGGVNLPGAGEPEEAPTKVSCLSVVIPIDQFTDDQGYEDLVEDMREEGSKFGDLTNVVIPHPNPNEELVHLLVKVFLEYADTAGCANAWSLVGGRKFCGNAVTAIYYPEDRYFEGDYGA